MFKGTSGLGEKKCPPHYKSSGHLVIGAIFGTLLGISCDTFVLL